MRRFVYNAKIVYVHEGNQFDVVLDLGFYIFVRQRILLNGLDIPSIRSSSETERQQARDSKDCAMKFLLNRSSVMVETFKHHKDGVWLANIYLAADTNYSQTKIDLEGTDYIDVCKYMRVLADSGYDVSKVDIPTMMDAVR